MNDFYSFFLLKSPGMLPYAGEKKINRHVSDKIAKQLSVIGVVQANYLNFKDIAQSCVNLAPILTASIPTLITQFF